MRKYPAKSNFGVKGFIIAHSSRLQSTIPGKSQCLGLGTAAHIVFMVKSTIYNCQVDDAWVFFNVVPILRLATTLFQSTRRFIFCYLVIEKTLLEIDIFGSGHLTPS